MVHDISAIYEQGVLRPLEPLRLPDGTRVHLRVEAEDAAGELPPVSGRVHSPRLANPAQAGEFQMEVREISDAGV
jgi:predicted DNA-binding antitoxin AbrB/MazE fold protein